MAARAASEEVEDIADEAEGEDAEVKGELEGDTNGEGTPVGGAGRIRIVAVLGSRGGPWLCERLELGVLL